MNYEYRKFEINAIFDLTIRVRKIKRSKREESMILWSVLNIPHTTYVQYLFLLHQLNLFMVLLDEKSTHSNLSPSLSSTHPSSQLDLRGDFNGLLCSSSIKRSNDFSSSPIFRFDRGYSSMNSLHEKFPNVRKMEHKY